MAIEVAQRLAMLYDPARVMIVATAARSKTNPAGFACRALEGGWEIANPNGKTTNDLADKARSCARGRGDECAILASGRRWKECECCRLAI